MGNCFRRFCLNMNVGGTSVCSQEYVSRTGCYGECLWLLRYVFTMVVRICVRRVDVVCGCLLHTQLQF